MSPITLTSAELAEIVTAIGELLPDTCTLGTLTHTSDGEGGFSDSRGTVSSAVPCRLDSIQMRNVSNEELAAGQITPFHSYVLTLPATATIDESYWVKKSDTYYQVRSVDTNKSWPSCLRAYVERE